MSDEEWAEVPGSEGTIVVRTLPDGSARYRVAVEAVPALVEGLRGKLKVAEAEIAALRAKVERMERVVEAAKRLYHGHPQTTAEEYNSAWNGLRDALIALDAGLEVDRG